jgi:hypothetical protein
VRHPGKGEAALLIAGDALRFCHRLQFDLAGQRRRQPAVDAHGPVLVLVNPDHDRQAVAVERDRPALLLAADGGQPRLILADDAGHLGLEAAHRQGEFDLVGKVGRHRIGLGVELADAVEYLEIEVVHRFLRRCIGGLHRALLPGIIGAVLIAGHGGQGAITG